VGRPRIVAAFAPYASCGGDPDIEFSTLIPWRREAIEGRVPVALLTIRQPIGEGRRLPFGRRAVVLEMQEGPIQRMR